ncbi:E3 ubiquitin-protein ligase RNF43-like [Carica papaya]|uniref:E3 ubiquitin-protein ligase RNF43-like n=1 Tax=Carica papaya TaxID=3649 RepID=UPI000B8CAB06|nr:E3 ubiquitin-protein ligase RNF43-like [Carica papaya]
MQEDDVTYYFRVIVKKDHNPPENDCPPPTVTIRVYNCKQRHINLGDVRAFHADCDRDGFLMVTGTTLYLKTQQSFPSHQIAEKLNEIGVTRTIKSQIMLDIQCKMNSRSPAPGDTGSPAVVRSIRILLSEIKQELYRYREMLEKVSWPLTAENGESSNDDDGVEQCVICMEEFLGRPHLSRTACSHVYHSLCIAKWLALKKSCPICRFPILETDI